MPYVNIDIDLSDFDADDLVAEICLRIKNKGCRKSLTFDQIKDIKKTFNDLIDVLKVSITDNIRINTLEDKIKYEHIAKVWNKYTSADLEKLLPE